MPPGPQEDPAADEELRALLGQLKQAYGLSYDELAAAAPMARNTVLNYVTRPGHRRDTRTLEKLLTALSARDPDRARALELHRRTQPTAPEAADVGWLVRARLAECTVWTMDEFTADEATVHTAIGRRHRQPDHAQGDVDAPPAYVPRVHDEALRTDIAQAAAGTLKALIVVRGTSSTGKTRSLWEAVHALCPAWMVVRPRGAAAVRKLPESGLFDRPVVIWLNELQGFLGPNRQGLSLDVLRDLFAAAANTPAVLVGTLWPEKLHTATDPRDDTRSDTRELLAQKTRWVRWHDIAPALTTNDERAAARELANADHRLADAVADADRFGFAQTLAGAYELLEHYRTAPTMARLLLDAAADARRLGHSSALPEALLRALALALWRDQYGRARLPDPGWFTAALACATQPLRAGDGVRALIPVDPDTDASADDEPGDDELGAGEPAHCGVGPGAYGLADYLEQHLTRTRSQRSVPDGVWHVLRTYVIQPNDLRRLSEAADNRGRYRHVEGLLRAAAASDPGALGELAEWLSDQPGRDAEAEQIWRDGVTAGDPDARRELAWWLSRQPGREADAEQVYRDSVAAGDPDALRALAGWLSQQPGRQAEAEAVYREAAGAGDPYARRMLARWLSERLEGEADAEQVWRVAAGDLDARRDLTWWLNGQPGREADAERVWRDAVAAGDRDALSWLARWLSDQPGRETETEQVWRDAAAAGNRDALSALARWLSDQPGRETETEQVWRDAAAGYPDALHELAEWLSRQPGRETEAEQIWRDAAAAGDPDALSWLTAWLSDQPGRAAEAEQLYRDRLAAGGPDALSELAGWLRGQPGRETEAEQLTTVGVDARGRTAKAP